MVFYVKAIKFHLSLLRIFSCQRKKNIFDVPVHIHCRYNKIVTVSKATEVASSPFHDWKYIHKDQNLRRPFLKLVLWIIQIKIYISNYSKGLSHKTEVANRHSCSHSKIWSIAQHYRVQFSVFRITVELFQLRTRNVVIDQILGISKYYLISRKKFYVKVNFTKPNQFHNFFKTKWINWINFAFF